jgi:hypothetical protein
VGGAETKISAGAETDALGTALGEDGVGTKGLCLGWSALRMCVLWILLEFLENFPSKSENSAGWENG